MDWNITWIIIGAISFVLAIANLIRCVFFKKNSNSLIFCSLSFGAFTILEEYKIVGNWIEYENSALLQLVPKLTVILSSGLWLLIIINLIALIIARKSKYLLNEASMLGLQTFVLYCTPFEHLF